MARFYCPGCWMDFQDDLAQCPVCGLDIRKFWDSKDYVEKLILALRHPEPTTPLRAAWLLGKTGDPRAVCALIDLFESADDVYTATAAVKALGEVDNAGARRFLDCLADHPVGMIRREVRKVLRKEFAKRPDSEGS